MVASQKKKNLTILKNSTCKQNLVPAFQTDPWPWNYWRHQFFILCLHTFLPWLRFQPLPQRSYTDLLDVCSIRLLVRQHMPNSEKELLEGHSCTGQVTSKVLFIGSKASLPSYITFLGHLQSNATKSLLQSSHSLLLFRFHLT